MEVTPTPTTPIVHRKHKLNGLGEATFFYRDTLSHTKEKQPPVIYQFKQF